MSIKNKINIKGDIKAGGSVSIGNTQIQAEDIDAEDYAFNVNHNDLHTENLVIQKNNEIYVNGEKLPHIPKLFGWSCVVNNGSRLYINGREKIKGEWKLTLRAIIACLFG